MNSKLIRRLIYLITIVLLSCRSNTGHSSCDSKLSDIPSERVNTDLTLTVIYDNYFTLGKEITLSGDNYSDHVLETMPDRDLEVYWLDSTNQWIKINNNISYSSATERIGIKGLDDPGGRTYFVNYDKSQVVAPTIMCLILRAVKDPEGDRINVASFIEVEINK